MKLSSEVQCLAGMLCAATGNGPFKASLTRKSDGAARVADAAARELNGHTQYNTGGRTKTITVVTR